MILELIATLGLTILFTETPKIDCGYANYDGCFFKNEKIIYLVHGISNMDRVLWHEIGHQIFWSNEETINIIKHYPPLISEETQNQYISRYPNVPNIIYEERIANYFAEYKLNPKIFSVKYPCLYIYFRDTLNKLI